MSCYGNFNKILYDTNSIIYYCFNHTEKLGGNIVHFRVIEFTNKSINFTQYLINNNVRIETIIQVINEILDKGVAKIVEEYCNDGQTKDLIGISRSREIPRAIKLRLVKKTEDKINELRKKSWFSVINYSQNREAIGAIKDFYRSLESTVKMIAHMRIKNKSVPWPSSVDMMLLAYSKENGVPILTNDTDFTNFKEELQTAALCFGIIELSETSMIRR